MKQEISPRVAIVVIAAVLALIGGWWYWRSTVHRVAVAHNGAATHSGTGIGHDMAQSMREMGRERMQRMAHRQNPSAASPPAQGGP